MITIWELYEKYGFNIIPMNADGKHPALKTWKHYHGEERKKQGQRVDPDDLKQWLGQFEKFAVLTGYWSGVVVVDCDSPEAFEFASSFCPPTPMVVLTGIKDPETGWRGRHLYYRHPEADLTPEGRGTGWIHQKIKVYRDPLNPDKDDMIAMDVKGDGHYVIAPGSPHKSGVYYEPEGEWNPDLLNQIPVFEWKWFPPHARAGWTPPPPPSATRTSDNSEDCTLSSYERGKHWIAQRDPAIEGQGGDNHTYLTARNLFELGCSETEVLDLMSEWNQTCVPPWGEAALARKVRHASRKGAGRGKATPIYEKGRREREAQNDDFVRSLNEPPAKTSDRNQDTPDKNSPKAERKTDAPKNDGEATAKKLNPIDLDAERKKRDKRPVIQFDGDLFKVILATVEQVKMLNEIPQLYQKDGGIVRVIDDEKGSDISKKIEPLTEDGLVNILTFAIDYHEHTKAKGWHSKEPPIRLVKSLRAEPSLLNLPTLERVVSLPQMAHDGHVCDTPGYDPVTRTYYSPLPGRVMPGLPDHVTPEHIAKARRIIDEIFSDFVFVEDGKNWYGEPCSASYCHAFATVLSGVARSQMRGKYICPLLVVESSFWSAGKSKLARCLLWAATGLQYATLTPMGKDQLREWDNQFLTAHGHPGESVFIDNAETVQLNHPTMKKALTEPYYSGRIMKQHTLNTYRNDKIWATSINNGEPDEEIVRRSVMCAIQRRHDYETYRWKHTNLDAWVQDNIHYLAWAVRVIVRGWIQAGRPFWRALRPEMCAGRDGARASVDSFEEWGLVMGGIMDWLGIHGFYTNRDTSASESNIFGSEADEFFEVLWKKFGQNRFTGSEAAMLLDGEFGSNHKYLIHSVTIKNGESLDSRAAASAVGRWLSKHRGQTRRKLTLKKSKGRGGTYYEMEPVDDGPGEHKSDMGEHWENMGFTLEKPHEKEPPTGSGEQGELFSEYSHVREKVSSHDHENAHGALVGEDVHPCSPDEFTDPLESRINSGIQPDRTEHDVCSPDMFSRDNFEKNSVEEGPNSIDIEQNGLKSKFKPDRTNVPTIQEALQWSPDRLRSIRMRTMEFQIWERYCEDQFGKSDYPTRRPTRRDGNWYLQFDGYSRVAPRRHGFVREFWDALYDGAETRDERK